MINHKSEQHTWASTTALAHVIVIVVPARCGVTAQCPAPYSDTSCSISRYALGNSLKSLTASIILVEERASVGQRFTN